MVVERIEARAWLEDASEEIARARAQLSDGDESWARWLEELERGEAVVATLQVTVRVTLPDAGPCVATARNHGIWLELSVHPPLVEGQVAEIATKDFSVLAERLREMGVAVSADDLSEMQVHVELGPELLDAIRARTGVAEPRPDARVGVTTETGHDVAVAAAPDRA